jgi:hypothetical protein
MAPTLTAVIDSFNRANEDPIANGWTGPFVPAQAQNRIVSNQMVKNAAAGSQSYWNTQFGPDAEVIAKVGIRPTSTNGLNLFCRMQNPNTTSRNAYWFTSRAQSGTDQYELYRVQNGGFTQLGSTINGPNYSVGDKIALTAIGSTITGWIYQSGAWTQIITQTDTNVAGDGYCGGTIDDATGAWDDFIAGTSLISFMSTPVLSNFIGADENPLSEGGLFLGPLEFSGGALKRASNAALSTTGGVSSDSRYWSTQLGADQEVWVQLGSVKIPDNDNYSLFTRIANPGLSTQTWYELAVQPAAAANDIWAFYKNVLGGGSTLIQTLTATEIAAGGYIGCRVQGNKLSAYYMSNASGSTRQLIGQVTDTSITGAGYIGIAMRTGSAAQFEKMGGGIVGTRELSLLGVGI